MLRLPASVERVVRDLREDILRGRLRPGDRIPSERDLVDRIGVNRGAVREGLRALAQLGLIEIAPRGAQVAPVSEASLDILGHLLTLDELPDVELADQVLEVQEHVFGAFLRLAIENGNESQIEEARVRIQALGDLDLSDEDYLAAMDLLMETLVNASGNFVLRLVGRGLQFRFWSRIQHHGIPPRVEPKLLLPRLKAIDEALARRDALGAAECGVQFIRVHRDQIIQRLNEEHERHAQEGADPQRSDSLLGHLNAPDATEVSI